jgi:hypothetical protein
MASDLKQNYELCFGSAENLEENRNGNSSRRDAYRGRTYFCERAGVECPHRVVQFEC